MIPAFFLLVLALSIPFWILGAATGIHLLPGLPIGALMVLAPAGAALMLVNRSGDSPAAVALSKRAVDYDRIPSITWRSRTAGEHTGILRRPARDEDTPMSISQALLPEFDQEMVTTRKLLERVPSDKGAWKPHPKSFALGHLAQLVATMPGWMTTMLRFPDLDLAKAPGYSLESTDSLLEKFDRHVVEARDALKDAKDSDFALPWSLKHGDRVLFTAPRGVVVRQHINHLVHHRGQLSVYLRLNDVPLPSMYGPTADESW